MSESVDTDQTTLSESVDEGRCQAYADRTGERCQHDALPGVPYCHHHYHLLLDGEDS